jgi:hypothetical protein
MSCIMACAALVFMPVAFFVFAFAACCILPMVCLVLCMCFWYQVFYFITSWLPSFCAQAAGSHPPIEVFTALETPSSTALTAPADAAPATEPADSDELPLEDLSADTVALHDAEKARWLATLAPASPKRPAKLPAAHMQKNAQDRCAALATRAAAKAGRPSLTPEERAALLSAARKRADGTAQVSRLSLAEAEAGLSQEEKAQRKAQRIAEAQRFAVEHAAQQFADVLDVHCCNMTDAEQWAAYEAAAK